MLRMIINLLIEKYLKPKKKLSIEEISYEQKTYPIYLCVRQAFNYCIKNRLMRRTDILEFKSMLNSYIRNSYIYQHKKYSNDVHEIYSKLKNYYIKPKEMHKLLKFVNSFIKAENTATQ
ncbi:hypothetical protein ACJDU8_21685 [Clostridium sp. WILCCON 0269]|uniref:Uncharacterized protein n=1 Tax=Candidatus Clostridium eludens TaxID=3381663 RepID=A0ABW8SQC4_9CLOT